MLIDERTPAFYVDVNAADDEDRVGVTVASLVPGSRAVDEREFDLGTAVVAVDADDNACSAVVVDRKGRWLELQLDASTWEPLPHAQVRVSLAPLSPEEALRALLSTPHERHDR